MEDKKQVLFCSGGGCTAKLGAGVLERILSRLPRGEADPALLVGFDSRDDAAVYRVSDDTAIVQTLDFFPPMVEDPYLFGQIAAANAVSDIYAMGGTVRTALNIVCYPENMDLNVLGTILQGGSEKVIEAGGTLVGGHSIADSGVKYGLSVMGTVDPAKMLRNNTVVEGDCLILTKRLGVGLICTAARVGEASGEALDAAMASMTMLNRTAAETAADFPVHACTDVTGFGLLVHLDEMLDGRFSAELSLPSIPVFPEAVSYAKEFLYTAAGQRNRNYMKEKADISAVPFEMQEVLFDPQTSGGLLFSVPADAAQDLERELVKKGLPARIIGKVIKREKKSIRVTV